MHLSPKCKTYAGNDEFFFQLQANDEVVCDIDKFGYMMGHCDNCPALSVLISFLRNELLKVINTDETVQFSQWVSNDRNQLVEEKSELDDFIENLMGRFGKLTKHHYIIKKKVEFFKQIKENLKFGESVIVLDLAECQFSRMLPKDSIGKIHRQQYTLL